MNQSPTCEICGQNDWEILGTKTYSPTSGGDSKYRQKRFKVLFDKWFPDHSTVTLTSTLCKNCGFICYTPRPEASDIDTKYRYLEELGQDYGGKRPYDALIEKHRSREILRFLKKEVDLAAVDKILDYGGGDGRLMQAFLGIGKECYLMDFNQNCIPGVVKIADTIDGLKAEDRFDLIICSHVIEHVAEPREVVEKLTSHLSDNGVIFIEVPMEVWKKPPLHREPVTHINFFTKGSVVNLLNESGLQVLVCGQYPSVHAATLIPVVKAIGRKMPNATKPSSLDAKPDGHRLLNPSLFDQVLFYSRILGTIPSRFLRRFF